MTPKKIEKVNDVTIRFAGDSGDGIQITGTQFANTTAILGNDVSTLPDYPAEIRAPQGTLGGVSGFQIHFGSTEINTPGDMCDVLVVMNPAALKANLQYLEKGGSIIANSDGFNERSLALAEYSSNPLRDGSLSHYHVYEINITKLTEQALCDLNLPPKVIERSKNFFALGLMFWMYNRPLEPTLKWIREKFSKKPELIEANSRVLKAGWNFGETTEVFKVRYEVAPARVAPGKYRNITGNQATAFGLMAAAHRAQLELFLASYPITPASDILHELSNYKNYNVKTFQCEDEIAAITAAIGASFGGALAVTSTSGPGFSLKAEALGLAVMTELPLVVINVQRGGPSTGLPTKTEQADLLQALYGRNGEASVPVIAALSPSDCFSAAFEACKIAIEAMTPVILLTDGYIGNGSEPWLIPDIHSLPTIEPYYPDDPKKFKPYMRNETTLVRPWAIPGIPGFEHRIGGLEKKENTGEISYDPVNHERMTRLRTEKIMRLQDRIPLATAEGHTQGDLLVIGWGSTFGAIRTAVQKQLDKGKSVAHLHLRYLNPFPKNFSKLISQYKAILVPELNLGQLAQLIRARCRLPIYQLNKVQGLPFRSVEIEQKIEEVLRGIA
ncbi:MAG: 2-oxoacid:acceptor oxidoreductase subunit alpha [Bacteroidetes bacterium]|nr:2-oxoacid:acceptor oxidoreductase subunit alpha [Bacteroidota bacterium]